MYSPKSLRIKNIISYTDVHYQFRNGEAIIIVGLNHDNASQKNNGSGKSALIEALALAFCGTSIRDVKVKELVNRQATDGEIDLILHNSITDKQLRIYRKLYTGTKSAECRIWIGDQEVRLPDINSYNKFVFDEIGISKDDFFNFFLLVQANYQPFLRVGDTKKKEIINRFSGADSIDQIFPFIKADVANFEPQSVALQQAIVKQETQIEIYQNKVDELTIQLNNLDQEKQIMKDKVVAQQTTYQNAIASYNKDIATAQTNLKAHQDALAEITRTDQTSTLTNANIKITATIQDNTKTIATLKSKIANVQNDFIDDIAAIKSEEAKTNATIKEVADSITEYEEFESEVSKQILDSIECPNCHHKFTLRNKDFNHQEAVEQLPLIQQDLINLKEQKQQLQKYIEVDLLALKQDINTQILAKQEQFNKQVVQLNNDNVELNNTVSKNTTLINNINNSITSNNNQIKAINNSIDSYNVSKTSVQQSINQLQQQIQEIDKFTPQEEINQLQLSIAQCNEKLNELKTQTDEHNQLVSSYSQWDTNFKNFKSFVANQSIKNIEDYTNLFLQQMGSDLTIYLDGFSTLATGKLKEQISVEVLRGGFSEGSYGAFSGGERGRIDICCILAIQQLINLNCTSGGLDLLICDEILDQVDSFGLESIIQSLQNIDRTIMIVSQNEINALKNHTLLVEKRNKVSTFTN